MDFNAIIETITALFSDPSKIIDTIMGLLGGLFGGLLG